MPKILAFSCAMNGYQWKYQPLLDSQKAYCERHGYRYVAVTRPSYSVLGLEVAWLKIRLIIDALHAGYEAVLFFDADVQLSNDAPAIDWLLENEPDVYAARGFSGHLNSGVLFVRNTQSARRFFYNLLRSSLRKTPEEKMVGWGENDHFISLAKQYEGFGELDVKWNNNTNAFLKDFARHYSRGPLHYLYEPPRRALFIERVCHYGLAILRRVHSVGRFFSEQLNTRSGTKRFLSDLDRLAQKVRLNYPELYNS